LFSLLVNGNHRQKNRQKDEEWRSGLGLKAGQISNATKVYTSATSKNSTRETTIHKETPHIHIGWKGIRMLLQPNSTSVRAQQSSTGEGRALTESANTTLGASKTAPALKATALPHNLPAGLDGGENPVKGAASADVGNDRFVADVNSGFAGLSPGSLSEDSKDYRQSRRVDEGDNSSYVLEGQATGATSVKNSEWTLEHLLALASALSQEQQQPPHRRRHRRRRRRQRREADGNFFTDVMGLDPYLDDVIGDFIGAHPQSRLRERRRPPEDFIEERARKYDLKRIAKESFIPEDMQGMSLPQPGNSSSTSASPQNLTSPPHSFSSNEAAELFIDPQHLNADSIGSVNSQSSVLSRRKKSSGLGGDADSVANLPADLNDRFTETFHFDGTKLTRSLGLKSLSATQVVQTPAEKLSLAPLSASSPSRPLERRKRLEGSEPHHMPLQVCNKDSITLLLYNVI
jgi:hypothetical protein